MFRQKAIRPSGPGTTARAGRVAIRVAVPRAKAIKGAERRVMGSPSSAGLTVPLPDQACRESIWEDEGPVVPNRLGESREKPHQELRRGTSFVILAAGRVRRWPAGDACVRLDCS